MEKLVLEKINDTKTILHVNDANYCFSFSLTNDELLELNEKITACLNTNTKNKGTTMRWNPRSQRLEPVDE